MTNKTLTQEQLRVVSDRLVDKLDTILEYFDVKLYKDHKKYYGQCPIHKGDSKTAFNLYTEGVETTGNWNCYTQSCHKKYKSTIIGFIRGLITVQKYGIGSARYCTFQETLEWVEDFLNEKLVAIKVDPETLAKQNFVKMMKKLEEKDNGGCIGIKIGDLPNMLSTPSPYFLSRGYSKEILLQHHVGDCSKSGREMNGRAVVPVIIDNKIVGVTGRSVYDRCKKCRYYHNPNYDCPREEIRHLFSKWRNSKNFKAERFLYNYDEALSDINETFAVTIVESPGNLWRLKECGVKNVVATFGAHLTEDQLDLILKTRANIANILMDNDDAGRTAAKLIEDKLKKLYNINIIFPSKEDVSCLSCQEIKNEIIPQLKQWRF